MLMQYLTSPPPDPEWDEYIQVRAAASASIHKDPREWQRRLSAVPGAALADAIDTQEGLLDANKLVPGNYPETKAQEAFELALQYADLLRCHYPELPPLPDRWDSAIRIKFIQLKDWCRTVSTTPIVSALHKTDAYRILLRKMFEVAIPAAKRPKMPSRKSLPDPTPQSLKAGYVVLQQKTSNDHLCILDVIALYGLDRLSASEFSKSSKYVQGSKKPGRPWRLPHVPKRLRRSRDRKTKAFLSTRWWTAAEVMRAFEGWATKLGVKLPTRF